MASSTKTYQVCTPGGAFNVKAMAFNLYGNTLVLYDIFSEENRLVAAYFPGMWTSIVDVSKISEPSTHFTKPN